MSPFDLGKLLWEARIKAAWGKRGDVLIARTPWPGHEAHPSLTEDHALCIAQARAVLASDLVKS